MKVPLSHCFAACKSVTVPRPISAFRCSMRFKWRLSSVSHQANMDPTLHSPAFQHLLPCHHLLVVMNTRHPSHDHCNRAIVILRPPSASNHLHDLEIRVLFGLIRAEFPSNGVFDDNHVTRQVDPNGKSRRTTNDTKTTVDESLLNSHSVVGCKTRMMYRDASFDEFWSSFSRPSCGRKEHPYL